MEILGRLIRRAPAPPLSACRLGKHERVAVAAANGELMSRCRHCDQVLVHQYGEWRPARGGRRQG